MPHQVTLRLLDWARVERVFLHPSQVYKKGEDPLFQAIVGYRNVSIDKTLTALIHQFF